ncbi:FkbM family methyltransferase [Hyphomonas sp. CACIAM 19H1]|nr:FkbM family methyltransferase [Hyphomonas sp. CACIAM 19H1]
MMARLDGAFLDVGANTGLYTVLAASARNDCIVHAFEPYEPIIRVFEDNVLANQIQDRVRLHEVALSDERGEVTLYLPDASHGMLETSASLEPEWGDGPKSKIQIERIPLDDIELPKISLVKADIEGHEATFLAGAMKMVQKDRPIILIEILHIANFEKLAQFLADSGYLDFRLRPDMAIQSFYPAFDPQSWNHAFVPPEKLPFFMEVCEASKLEVVTPLTLPEPEKKSFWARLFGN